MTDSGSQFDNPINRRHGLAVTPAELGTPIPIVRPLSTEEIIKVEKSRLGLRITDPAKLAIELTDGVSGDYVVISNVGNFLKLKTVDPFNLGLTSPKFDGISILSAIDKDRLDLVEGLGTLSVKYNQALLACTDEALKLRTRNIYSGRIENITLRQYFSRYTLQDAPAYLLIQGDVEYPPRADETGSYYGFGKYGSGHIDVKDMIGHCQLTQDDIRTLEDRYELFLYLPVGTDVQTGGRITNLADIPVKDIRALLQGKVLEMIRNKLK